MSRMTIALPVKLTLTKPEAFILNAAKQGGNSVEMAAKVFAAGSVRCTWVVYPSNLNGMPCYVTNIQLPEGYLSIREDELKYFAIEAI